MSQDTLKFTFQMDPTTPTVDELAASLVALFEQDGEAIRELATKKQRKEGYIAFWPPQGWDDAVLEAGLRLLARGSGDRAPYAELEMDQTNDTFFYALTGNHLVRFDTRQEVLEHLSSAGSTPIEETLAQQVPEGSTALFVRLKFGKKRPQNALLKAARAFMTDRTAEGFQAFKEAIDTNTSSPEDVDFPFTNLWRDDFARENMSPEATEETFELMKSMRDDESEDDFYDRIAPRLAWLKKQRFDTEPLARSELGNLELGRALLDCVADGKHLTLLFVHTAKFGIVPCNEDDLTWQARNNIRNGEGFQVLELLECFQVLEGVDSLSAKLYSPLEGASASFSGDENGVECTPWFANAPLPPAVWP